MASTIGRARVGTLAVAVTFALWFAPGNGNADEHDRAIIDQIDVRPSPIFGMARVRALVSATELQGARIPHDWKPALTVKLGGSKVPFVVGLSTTAEVEVDLVIVIATTDVFTDSLDRIREAIDHGLLAPLEKLGPRVQLAIVGYDHTTVEQKRLGTATVARAAMAALRPDENTTEVALIGAVTDAIALARRTKPKTPGVMQRPIVVVVSDGDGIALETRPAITKLAAEAGKRGVRIHTLGYSPIKARRSLLTLGELSKQSGGTFRWIQEMEGWPVALEQLVDQLTHQYVITALVPDDAITGKKLTVSIESAAGPLDAAPVKAPAPRCGKAVCESDEYCVRDVCIAHARRPGAGPLRWILIGLGGVLGLLALGFVVRSGLRARNRGPRPARLPIAVAAPVAAAPAVAAPSGGPVLIVLSGPEANRQVPLHHGFALGKAPTSDLSLAHDGFASTNHAQVTFDGSAWTLTDLGSTNGTFANGTRVTSVKLFPGMTVRVGSTDVRFWQP
jgi:Inner membrane component of T3SS, cytoplasmic domain